MSDLLSLYVLLSPLCPALRDSPICAFSQSKSCPTPPHTRLRLLLALSSRLLTALRSHCVALTARCYDSAPLSLPCSCSICPIYILLPPHSALLAVLPCSAALHQSCDTVPLRPVLCSPLLLSSLPCPCLHLCAFSQSLLPPLARFLISVNTNYF